MILSWWAAGAAGAAEKKTVAVLDFPAAARVQQAVVLSLKKDYVIVPLPKWNAAAKRLNATGKAADEIALVAADLKVDAVITGSVKKDKESGGYVLSVSPRHGPTGKPVEKLRYPLKKTPKVDKATLAQLLGDLKPALEKAFSGPPEKPVVAEAEPKPEEVAQINATLGKDDDPMENVRKMQEEDKKKAEAAKVRPSWYTYIDVAAGIIIGGRRFGYDEELDESGKATGAVGCYNLTIPELADGVTGRIQYRYSNRLSRCPTFNASIAPGIRAELTFNPLAGLSLNALRGLGVGVLFDYMFWQPSKVCTRPDSCGPDLATTEFKVEAGLRWQWNIFNQRNRPSLRVGLFYGLHQFAIAKVAKTYETFTDPVTMQTVMPQGLEDNGLPDIRYQYLNVGLGAKVPYFANERWSIGGVIDFSYLAVLDYGEIATSFQTTSTSVGLYQGGGYGPVSGGYGFRVALTAVELQPWKGLTFRLSGYYELYAMNFLLGSGSASQYNLQATNMVRAVEDGARHLARGASDQYFGGVVQVGYQY